MSQVFVLASQATAARRRIFFDLRLLDGISPATTEAGGQPQISTDGGAWTNTGIGTLSAIGQGRYYADLDQGSVATAGHAIETRYKSGNTAESPGDSIRVVAFDPDSAASLGLSSLVSAASDASTAAAQSTTAATQATTAATQSTTAASQSTAGASSAATAASQASTAATNTGTLLTNLSAVASNASTAATQSTTAASQATAAASSASTAAIQATAAATDTDTLLTNLAAVAASATTAASQSTTAATQSTTAAGNSATLLTNVGAVKTVVDGIASSTGAGTGSLVVTATAPDGSPALGVHVWMQVAATHVTTAYGITDSAGHVTFQHEGGAFLLLASKSGSLYSGVSKTLTVGENGTVALPSTSGVVTVNPSNDPTLCIVYAFLRGIDAQPAAGVIGTMEVTALPETGGGGFVGGQEISATSDASGLISWPILRAATVTVRIPDYLPGKVITVPSAATLDLYSVP